MITKLDRDKGREGQARCSNEAFSLFRAIYLNCDGLNDSVVIEQLISTLAVKHNSVLVVMNSSAVIEMANYSTTVMQKVIDFRSNDGIISL